MIAGEPIDHGPREPRDGPAARPDDDDGAARRDGDGDAAAGFEPDRSLDPSAGPVASPAADFEPDSEAEPTVASWRPGPIRWWWLREVRGWPPDLPPDRELVRRCLDEAGRPDLDLQLDERFRRAGGELGRFPAILALVELAVWTPLFILPFTHGLGPTLIWLAIVVLVEWKLGRAVLKRWFHPRLRAVLRRHGVDCCIRCGHLAGGGSRTTACPECGQRHESFPLRWNGDLARR